MGIDVMNNEVVDPHLTTKIVSSYVRYHAVGVTQVSELITSVHRALAQFGQPIQPNKFIPLLSRSGSPYATTMWFASIAAL